MPRRVYTDADRAAFLRTLRACGGNKTAAARKAGISRNTAMLWAAEAARYDPPASLGSLEPPPEAMPATGATEKKMSPVGAEILSGLTHFLRTAEALISAAGGPVTLASIAEAIKSSGRESPEGRGPSREAEIPTPPAAGATMPPVRPATTKGAGLADELLARLRKGPVPLAEVCRGVVADLTDRGYRLHEAGGLLSLDRRPPIGGGDRPPLVLLSDRHGVYRLGLTGDTHIGSKYFRPDVIEGLYDLYAAEGVQAVLHTGNWIEGEAPFNLHDRTVYGMDAQLRELARVYPRRPGVITYAIAGDDHEGWYAQRSGVDIGRMAERAFRDAGRDDWHDIGYMEAHVVLRHRETGAEAILTVMHPGGGSAYATSYAAQKVVESFGGGEKPAVLAIGHYHKLDFLNIRNVWVYQTGTAQDQTPFMRKRRLEAHVGGHLATLWQDPRTGAIVEAAARTRRYFNVGYYDGRWSHSGPVTLPPTYPNGVPA
jgi:hypothetical protein